MKFGELKLEGITSALVEAMRENEGEEGSDSGWSEEEVPAARGVTPAALRAFNERDVSEAGIVGLMDVGNFLMVPVESLARIIVGGLEPGGRRTALGLLGSGGAEIKIGGVDERHRGIVDALPLFVRGHAANLQYESAIRSICEWGGEGSVRWAKWWARERGELDCKNVACDIAAESGNLEVLKWASDDGASEHLTKHTYSAAALGGHLGILKWAMNGAGERGCSWDNADVCSSAALGGHMDVLQWAKENGCPWDGRTCANAAGKGRLDILGWARENGCPWGGWVCAHAAKGGHLKILQWARAEGCPWNKMVCAQAARRGHMDVLQWARAQGCPWDSDTCSNAAKGGHLEVPQWARAQGCPWNNYVCIWAAAGGHMDVLKWAVTNGCSCDVQAYMYAKAYGHTEVVQWITGNSY